MATPLADRILELSPSKLYDMVETGWSSSVAEVELLRRGLPVTRPKPSRSGTRSFRANRRAGVTGGYVDRSRITPGVGPNKLPGSTIPPWHRLAR